MSQQDKKDAAARAALAAQQMKHATNNAGAAAESAAEAVKDEVVDGVAEAKNRLEHITQKMIWTEAGRGILAISLGIISAGVGIKKLQNANQIGKNIRKSLDKVET